jgi:T-complex protein 1 subunit alpha
MASLVIGGDRTTGKDIRAQNVMAASSIANIVKSSLGPVGLDKMLVDDIGDVTITNDGATILKLLEVEHPAAKILCELADLQDQEVGDGTTSVVIIAAELLKNASTLIKYKLHPTSIISGYRLACREACKYIQEHLAIATSELDRESVISCAKTAMSSKLVGVDSDFFSNMIVDAAMSIMRTDAKGVNKVPIKAINILKAHGGNMKESILVPGYALNCVVACEGMPKCIENAKIAFLDFSIQKAKMHLGVQVLVEDPEQLNQIRERESDITKERIAKILAAGTNCILTSGGIDDLCMKYFVEQGVMAVRRVKKIDLKRIARACGGTVTLSLANLEGEESFDASMLGLCDVVSQDRICDDELIIIKGPKTKNAASIILRGANDFMVDEMDRSIHDALCVVKRVLESKSIVPGGGAVEAALSIYLENFATSLASREQIAIAEFANSLLVIPKCLTVNAAKDSADLVAKLRAYHNASQTQADKAHLKWVGLDLLTGDVRDNRKAGVLEPAMSKIKCLKFATEAAITILRIDDMVNIEPEQTGDPNSYENARRSGQLSGR